MAHLMKNPVVEAGWGAQDGGLESRQSREEFQLSARLSNGIHRRLVTLI
jgi:hypothetical protein